MCAHKCINVGDIEYQIIRKKQQTQKKKKFIEK